MEPVSVSQVTRFLKREESDSASATEKQMMPNRMEQEFIKRRVVVTGLGAVTPLGNSVEATWAGLMAGRSGAGPITKFDAASFPVRFGCEVKDFDPPHYVEKKEARKMGAFTRYAIAASDEALADSDLKITDKNAEAIGVDISS